MAGIYENVVNEFSKRNCKLLVSQEEYYVIKKNATKFNFKLKYMATCGHIHNVYYNAFRSQHAGILCATCKSTENGKNRKQQICNKQISKLHNIEQEFNFIHDFKAMIHEYYDVVKAFDGCNVDVIIKPKYIEDDAWVGIQIKTTNAIRRTYSFHVDHNYKNCLILLCCTEDHQMWLIPENVIMNQQKISIGVKKSKYNIYKVTNMLSSLNDLYNTTSHFLFDVLNTPINIYQQRELMFRKYREEKILFLNFEYEEMEGTVYDFKINHLNVQEKVASIHNNVSYVFNLCKNNGKINNKRVKTQYDIGDNQLYWLNCDNKKHFYVIPEQILIDKGFIGNNKRIQQIKIPINLESHLNDHKWIEPFMFNYETINDTSNKYKLTCIISNAEQTLESKTVMNTT